MASHQIVARLSAAAPGSAPAPGGCPNSGATAARPHLLRRSRVAPAQSRRAARIGARSNQRAGRSAVASRVVAVAAADDVSVQELSNKDAHVSLRVTLSADFCKAAYDSIIKDASKESSVPGFRKGAKVPEQTMVGYLGGQREVNRLAVERALRDSLPQALAGLAENALAESERIESNPEQLIDSFSKTSGLEYQVGVDMPPKISFDVSYKNLKVSVPACSSPESEAEQIEQLIVQGQKDNGAVRIVQGRGMSAGDTVVIDIDVFKKGTDEALPGAQREKYQIDTGRPNAVFLPGIVEGMEGMEVGEERSIAIRFPENWDPPQLANMEVDAKIKLRELFEYDLAEESDELAGKLFPGATSMADLRQRLQEAISLEVLAINKSRVDAGLTEELVKITTAELPFQVIQTVGQQKYQAKVMEMQNKGQIAPEVFEQLLTPAMLQNYIKTNRQDVEDTVKAMLAVETIFKMEGLTLTDEEKQEYIRSAVEDMEAEGIEYDKDEMLGQAEEALVAAKALEWLENNCEVTMAPYDPEVEANM